MRRRFPLGSVKGIEAFGRVRLSRIAVCFIAALLFSETAAQACSPLPYSPTAPEAACPVGGERWVPYIAGCAGWGQPIYFTALDHLHGISPPTCPGNGFPAYRKFSADERARFSEIAQTDEFRQAMQSPRVYERSTWVADVLGEQMDSDLRFSMQLGTDFEWFVTERPKAEVEEFALRLIESLENGELLDAEPKKRNSALRMLAMAGKPNEARAIYDDNRPAWLDHPAFDLDRLQYDSLEICLDAPESLRLGLCHPKGMVGVAQSVLGCLNSQDNNHCKQRFGTYGDPEALADTVKKLSADLPKFAKAFQWGLSRSLPRHWETTLDCIAADPTGETCSTDQVHSIYIPRITRPAEYFSSDLRSAAKPRKAVQLAGSSPTDCPIAAAFPSLDYGEECTQTALRNLAFMNGRCLEADAPCNAMSSRFPTGHPVDLRKLGAFGIDPSPYLAFEQAERDKFRESTLDRLSLCRISQEIGDLRYTCPTAPDDVEAKLRRVFPDFDSRMDAAKPKNLRVKVERLIGRYVGSRRYVGSTGESLAALDALLKRYPDLADHAHQTFKRSTLIYDWQAPF